MLAPLSFPPPLHMTDNFTKHWHGCCKPAMPLVVTFYTLPAPLLHVLHYWSHYWSTSSPACLEASQYFLDSAQSWGTSFLKMENILCRGTVRVAAWLDCQRSSRLHPRCTDPGILFPPHTALLCILMRHPSSKINPQKPEEPKITDSKPSCSCSWWDRATKLPKTSLTQYSDRLFCLPNSVDNHPSL